MITCDQLIFIITSEIPGLVHGRDFLAGHPLDAAGNQKEEPFILQWKSTAAREPDVKALIARWPDYESAYAERNARMRRDHLLKQCDWSQGVDVPAALREKYVAYRQALRDVPQQAGFPADITWPQLPEGTAQ
ncbi:tail fiber assembly protein [Paraburkholderia sp. MM5384-R2]|uniref:tail fiber assembly protein n=1 Tax=Paraburkholderia sp. MM5384-R2 TaxID=2723097 RepID=UPI001617C438|nr:tail fiber assembly protein [Paraburkholderia sp. MM5384-R2]MBB5496884.1 DMSO/TMAO reductase YedYZ molybdopterin-dependent catalytic subunit [Paraburkholderia sp. MM5384-R2]